MLVKYGRGRHKDMNTRKWGALGAILEMTNHSLLIFCDCLLH